jgi:hypothetical protein
MTEPQRVISDLPYFWPDGSTVDPGQIGRAAIDRREAAGFRIEPSFQNCSTNLLELPLRETTVAAKYTLGLVDELDPKQRRELQLAVGQVPAMVRRLDETYKKGSDEDRRLASAAGVVLGIEPARQS